MSFDRLGVDSLLQVLHFSGARSLARVACGSRFGFVVAHEAQQNPALLVLKGRPDDVARELRERLASRPTVAFLQYSGRTEAALQFARSNLPPDTEVLGANTRSLLCAVESTAARGRPGTSVEVDHGSDQIGLLLATLPEG
ncbi:unnamed protein product [Prorocentrum cordatum]|uniref:Uncharacterized protein n=1 Tax=Prorocentrum cordatum TaxID=2364126 RepID=A0ABN9TWD0_9DINO|nr:unnamed protein product [Polarella glacialis]